MLLAVLISAPMSAYSDDLLWEPVDISKRNLYLGPGGTAMRPNVRRVTFLGKETGGNNLKYRIKDANGRVWVAKIADESRPEAAAVRLIWAVGYKTEINYLVPRLTIPGVGTFRNVRLEARPANVKRGDRWGWNDNPFVGSNEFQGLKIMMALINNWDLKDGNNIILETNGQRHYVVSDLGSAFGKMPVSSKFILNRFGRSVDRPDHFINSQFITGVNPEGWLDFAYKGKAVGLFDDVSRDHGAWLAARLRQLSTRQISDAFRAANYSPSEVRLLTRALQNRIESLDRVSRGTLRAAS
jgi:hypothetical protein